MFTQETMCENKEEHVFHNHELDVTRDCDGTTECGAWAHPKHTYISHEVHWCHGVCNCGLLSRGPHGPGAHK